MILYSYFYFYLSSVAPPGLSLAPSVAVTLPPQPDGKVSTENIIEIKNGEEKTPKIEKVLTTKEEKKDRRRYRDR